MSNIRLAKHCQYSGLTAADMEYGQVALCVGIDFVSESDWEGSLCYRSHIGVHIIGKHSWAGDPKKVYIRRLNEDDVIEIVET